MKPYHISEQGLELIKEFEGFRAESYYCDAGKKTIGYGHAIKNGEVFTEPMPPEIAENLLKQDLRWVEKTINNTVSCDLLQNEVDALCSLIYNIGGTAFRKSHLLEYLNNENYLRAADEFLKWCHIGDKVSNGLLKRRQKERELFLEG